MKELLHLKSDYTIRCRRLWIPRIWSLMKIIVVISEIWQVEVETMNRMSWRMFTLTPGRWLTGVTWSISEKHEIIVASKIWLHHEMQKALNTPIMNFGENHRCFKGRMAGRNKSHLKPFLSPGCFSIICDYQTEAGGETPIWGTNFLTVYSSGGIRTNEILSSLTLGPPLKMWLFMYGHVLCQGAMAGWSLECSDWLINWVGEIDSCFSLICTLPHQLFSTPGL